MTGCYNLFIRNCKLFFKDKGMFFASLITPVILLVLYAAFLANVYRDSFISALPEGFPAAEKLIGGIVGGQLVSSLLAVSCITVSFCCNMTMVLDKVTGARRDLTVSPVKKSTLALSYYLATFASTLLVCLIAAGAGFIYLAKVGWYLSFADVMLLFADIVLLVLFGTALSSIVNRFLTTQGQVSAVGTIVGLRFYLRRIYADRTIQHRLAAHPYVSARNIRNKPYSQSCPPRCILRGSGCGSCSRSY